MPLYEMMMVARVGEQQALSNSLKQISSTILSAGGIVRSMDNLGDRVLIKNLRSKDGTKYSLGRFLKLEFDSTPQLMKTVERQTRLDPEVLRVNCNKMKESEYIERTMKRINAELSPFRDPETFDEDYIRAMWTKYNQITSLREGSTQKEIMKDLPRVAAFVKSREEGPHHKDSQILQQWADGDLDKDDKQVRDYYI